MILYEQLLSNLLTFRYVFLYHHILFQIFHASIIILYLEIKLFAQNKPVNYAATKKVENITQTSITLDSDTQ